MLCKISASIPGEAACMKGLRETVCEAEADCESVEAAIKCGAAFISDNPQVQAAVEEGRIKGIEEVKIAVYAPVAVG